MAQDQAMWKDVESRILTALKTLDAVADPDRRFLYGATTRWPQVERELSDVLGDADMAEARGRLVRFRPTPAEVDDMLPALSLIGADEKPWLWLLRMRAYGQSYRQIATLRGRSDEFWRRKVRQLIEAMIRRAPSNSQSGKKVPVG